MREAPIDRENLAKHVNEAEAAAQVAGSKKVSQETAKLALEKLCSNKQLAADATSCDKQGYILRTLISHLRRFKRQPRKSKSCFHL